MPRDLPVGNGSLLINFDRSYQLRDIYFPHVGKENHSLGHPFRFGVWVDGVFRWIDEPRWQRSLLYESDTLVTRVALSHPDLPVSIVSSDAVDFHENVYVRRLAVTNTSQSAVEARFFFHHDFHIYENAVGDTAYYEPQRRVIFHYKDLRWFLINCCRGIEDHGVDQFATGIKESGGFQGTWADAEDGTLSGNPVAQGSVDSTVALHLSIPAGATKTGHYWIAAAERFDDVTAINRRILQKGPDTLIERTSFYWRLWIEKEGTDFADLPGEVIDLYSRSLLVVRTQIDTGGGIVAANDFDVIHFNNDTYSYVWPRDGALVARAITCAGYHSASRRFFDYCGRVLTKEGYFLHKYNPDGSLASSWHPWEVDGVRQLPIQEDETGLVIWALWNHFEHDRDVEFIKPLYRDLIIRAADFMVSYRDAETGLPLPSYDLWEERRGVLAWTVAATHAGLLAAAQFANAFGEEESRDRYLAAAAQLRAASDRHLWQEHEQRFVRMINRGPSGEWDQIDWRIDASIAGLFLFEMYDASDPRIVSTMEQIKERLWVQTPVGGMARYENDYYQQVSQDLAHCPGNPWFICTLWLAQWHIARATSVEAMAPAVELLRWAAQHALPSGVLAEQVDPYTGEPLSVSPLTWSHATVVQTVVDYLDKLSHLTLCPACGQPTFLRERRNVRALRQLDAPAAPVPAS